MTKNGSFKKCMSEFFISRVRLHYYQVLAQAKKKKKKKKNSYAVFINIHSETN